jgi:hypothetical protein
MFRSMREEEQQEGGGVSLSKVQVLSSDRSTRGTTTLAYYSPRISHHVLFVFTHTIRLYVYPRPLRVDEIVLPSKFPC